MEGEADTADVLRRFRAVEERVGDILEGADVKPSLLHGDLWIGGSRHVTVVDRLALRRLLCWAVVVAGVLFRHLPPRPPAGGVVVVVTAAAAWWCRWVVVGDCGGGVVVGGSGVDFSPLMKFRRFAGC